MRLNKKGGFLWIAMVMGLAWGGPSPSMAAVKEDMAPGRAMARQAMKKKRHGSPPIIPNTKF